jgi:DTW domain-containing protein YfiP
MYKGECLKPSNTGRLVADVVAENYAFTWHRTEPQPALLALLSRPDVVPVLIFPHEYAAPHRRLETLSVTSQDKRLLFILLDGTWREARKMFTKSLYLQHIPVIAVNPTMPSSYVLRTSHHDYQLCTAEVAIEILALVNETKASRDLSEYFQLFKRQYVKEKPHKQLSDD